jgi:hypothetical protein
MDKALQEALEFSNYRTTLENQKTNLKHRLQVQRTVSHAGGLFTATLELIAYTKFLVDSNFEQQVFIDENKIPVMVRDLPNFLNRLNEAYTTAMNEYFVEYEKTKRQRNVKSLVGVA